MRGLHLFVGCGGGLLGEKLSGITPVCAVEIDGYAVAVLIQRQRDGLLPPFPVWDDIKTFNPTPWIGKVDIITGGFPCQDISVAGRGAGLEGERSGLWTEMARVVGVVRPRWVFIENSPALLVRGGSKVVGQLAKMGYDSAWGIVSASNTNAPHLRERCWILAKRT